ncbi:kynureninase [Daejeonella oryzae]|uniref:kynureninase n=1 Tax=Daejeonella oryzae TaxID=1122943 RepID=UPI0004237370|nr:kynureninase [Daejeonella oryzae]
MHFENNLAFAHALDQADPLNKFRNDFLIPKIDGKEIIYLCGNSLGLQPKNTRLFINEQLDNWENLAVEGWFEGDSPWMFYHKEMQKLMAPLVGALPSEVVPMNNLSVNLHLMMVSFYRPDQKKFKIIMEGGAFPSDQYIVESQVRFHGLNPDKVIIEINPRMGEETLRTEDILASIEEHSNELALIMFAGINYYTGQFFDMKSITEAGHKAGAYVGFDLAHAAGNVPMSLHDWNVDFACWCTYKYMNSSPGGISGVFIHEKHFENNELNRFAGWWGYDEKTRFKMAKGFIPQAGAEGWQLSCSPVLMMAAHKASLVLFEEAGGIENLRQKSINLTAYLEFILHEVNKKAGSELFKIITPSNYKERGAQLSIIAAKNGKQIFDKLVNQNIIGDWREPNVIRISPVPFYNTFEDVYKFGSVLENSII